MKLHVYWLGLHPLDWEFCFMHVQAYKDFIAEQYRKNPAFYDLSAGSIEKVLARIDAILSALWRIGMKPQATPHCAVLQ